MSSRTLLLAPPSLSSHQERLNEAFTPHDRSTTDFQMLDRLALGLITLPDSTYDLILLLTDADGTRQESQKFLTRNVLSFLFQALKGGGKLRSQDGVYGMSEGAERTEAILAGLAVEEGMGFVKPDYGAEGTVSLPLSLRKRKEPPAGNAKTNGTSATNGAGVSLNGHSQGHSNGVAAPAGVGLVESLKDVDGDSSDDELIDEDELLGEEDMRGPVKIRKCLRLFHYSSLTESAAAACLPKAAKRRRACKDCTCGLAQKLEAEDKKKRQNADSALNTLKLGTNDLAEVDFTVQGKVGSCGNCSLGDAFRCDGCPYIGLPAFKPGEEVRLMNDDIQL